MQQTMFSQITAAAQTHPERVEFDRFVSMGHSPDRADGCLDNHPLITIKQGRASYKVRHIPGRLETLAGTVAKAPCWTGKKTPKKRLSVGSGNLYRHPLGFSIWLPDYRSGTYAETEFSIGKYALTLDHCRRTITGDVPASWLIDLNADSAVTHEVMP